MKTTFGLMHQSLAANERSSACPMRWWSIYQ